MRVNPYEPTGTTAPEKAGRNFAILIGVGVVIFLLVGWIALRRRPNAGNSQQDVVVYESMMSSPSTGN